MKVKELIALFETMLAEHWAYEWGAAREGCVDCSGAFVYAYKALGGGAIEHGSNTIGRKRVGKLLPTGEAKPGYAAFKRRDDGGEPEKYRGDGIGNLYHIGLVARDGKSVLNAKGTNYGFCADPLSKWACVAPLNAVTYAAQDEDKGKEEESMATLDKALVTTDRDPLRVRNAPETGRIIGHVPRGATVDVLTWGDWPCIRYGETVGYASGAYLTRVEEDPSTAAGGDPSASLRSAHLRRSDGLLRPLGAAALTPLSEEALERDQGSPERGAVERSETEGYRTTTSLVREDGVCIVLSGRWRVASD